MKFSPSLSLSLSRCLSLFMLKGTSASSLLFLLHGLLDSGAVCKSSDYLTFRKTCYFSSICVFFFMRCCMYSSLGVVVRFRDVAGSKQTFKTMFPTSPFPQFYIYRYRALGQCGEGVNYTHGITSCFSAFARQFIILKHPQTVAIVLKRPS